MKDKSKLQKILRFIALIFSSLSIVTTSIIGIVSVVEQDETKSIIPNASEEADQNGMSA